MALGILRLPVKAQCDICIEMHILAAYIDNVSIGTIISENDLIDAGCYVHKPCTGQYFLELKTITHA